MTSAKPRIADEKSAAASSQALIRVNGGGGVELEYKVIAPIGESP